MRSDRDNCKKKKGSRSGCFIIPDNPFALDVLSEGNGLNSVKLYVDLLQLFG